MGDLQAVAIRAELARLGAGLGEPLIVVAETDSTNDDARRALAAGAAHGAAFVADAQRRGRGRQGRTWHSPPGESLYLSVVLRPAMAAERVGPLPLVAGLAVADVVDAALRAPRARLKWPNDVLVADEKLAGVLVEGLFRGGAVAGVVVGIGLNVGATAFPPELAGRATSLRRLGASGAALDRALLAAALLARLGELVVDFERDGFAAVHDAVTARDALAGREVQVGEVHGVAAGIDAGGRLLVRTRDGVVPVVSGEANGR